MRSAKILAPCLVLVGAAACSSSWNRPMEEPKPKPAESRASTAATLGIPPGHLPPVGHCRVWMPGEPPGHQSPPRSCRGIEREAPAGSWILYRPGEDKKVVHVRVVDERRPGVVVRVRIYDAQRGTLIRDG